MNIGEINHNPKITELEADEGYQAQYLSGRIKYSFWTKLNPIWWFQNDLEPTPPDWYKPESKQWIRQIAWLIRNPLSNFTAYVLGVKDRDYVIVGTYPVDSGTLADIGKLGWKWSVIKLGWMRLPFIGYSGKRILFYVGWAWEGNIGAKFNILNSPLQGV